MAQTNSFFKREQIQAQRSYFDVLRKTGVHPSGDSSVRHCGGPSAKNSSPACLFDREFSSVAVLFFKRPLNRFPTASHEYPNWHCCLSTKVTRHLKSKDGSHCAGAIFDLDQKFWSQTAFSNSYNVKQV